MFCGHGNGRGCAADSGPTTIQIITEKHSDDSSDEEEGKKKQVIPTWARSPHLRRQLERQVDLSPTPVFGECKKTCDLAAMFVNHQPKRRRYDKRTSSADWGDDGRASFMVRALLLFSSLPNTSSAL